MEQPGQTLKASEDESVPDESHLMKQLHNSKSSPENEKDRSHTNLDQADADSNDDCHFGKVITTETASDIVVESPAIVSEGTRETQTSGEVKDSNATNLNSHEQPPLLVTSCSTEVENSGLAESPTLSSVQSTSKNSPTGSTTTSGISNGPSTPNSDIISSSLASSPQTSAKTMAPSHSMSSPYDTDCSRKLISQIERSLSQESLLDELESELLACQLPEGERKGSPPVNGLPKDQEGCMVVFEKCVQYKYAQQEKAIQG